MKDKRKEQASRESDMLWKSSDFLKQVIDNIGDPTLVIDVNYHILLANKALKKAFDGRDTPVKHMYCYQAVNHLNRPCDIEYAGVYPCPLKQTVSTMAPTKVIQIHHDPLGNEIFMEVTGRPIFNRVGKVVHVIESFHNITELKQEVKKLEKLTLDLQVTLAKTRTLSGILPICTSCKKIRDNKRHWKNIEVYIKERSEVEFSHILCPECKKSYMISSKIKKDKKDRKGKNTF